MIQSMTGYGRAAGRVLDREVSVEVRSVNNRFREVNVRLPRQYAGLEESIKKAVGLRVSRGRVDLNLQVEHGGGLDRQLQLDLDLARTYFTLLSRLKDELGAAGEVTAAQLAGYKDVIVHAEPEIDLDEFMAGLEAVLAEALGGLIQMRQTEGQAIAEDFLSRLADIRGWIKGIEARKGVVADAAKAKLEERISSLTDGRELDQGRLLQEVAYLMDRSDITEEIVRLGSHCDQFESLVKAGGVVGRRLEFLLQEINREVNTIGSKSGDVEITNFVLDLKTELEKLREQVQNVE